MIGEEIQGHRFTLPVNQILTMLVLTGLVAVGVYLIYPSLDEVFLESPYLNGVIVAVFVVGLLTCFGRVLSLFTSVNWIEGFVRDRPGHEIVRPPGLLVPLAALLRPEGARTALTTFSARSILDTVATRLDEGREITRYIINLLIFLGLLGTFYGLATSVPAVVDTIRSLAPSEDGESSVQVFENLIAGLERQLGGMGTAFGSSLLGLAGSLVVGLLDLFAGHGQNRFYRELEEWISSITLIGVSAPDPETGLSRLPITGRGIPSPVVADSALTEAQWGILVGTLNGVLSELSERHLASERQVDRLAQLVEQLASQPNEQSSVNHYEILESLAQSQQRIADALTRGSTEETTLDAETRSRLRNIESHLLRILEDMSVGRQDSIADVRADIAVLIETLRQAVEGNVRD